MRAAFMAMEKSLQARSALSPKTKGLVRGLEQYSAQQLFFMNYAFVSAYFLVRFNGSIFNY